MSSEFIVKGEALASVYGPVHSRRHGLSLGLNVGLTDHKICTWSCLYCQCGFGEKRDFKSSEPRITLNLLLDQVKLETLKYPNLDAVTLAGNSEPGTYPEILKLVRGLKKLRLSARAKWKIVILSNGSELDRAGVCDAFRFADEAWMKLDVGCNELFHLLNRPMTRVGGLSEHLIRIRRIEPLRIQTLIWSNHNSPKLSNSSEDNFRGLLECYSFLKPIQIHLTTVARDPALPGILPVDGSVLKSLAQRIARLNINVDVLV